MECELLAVIWNCTYTVPISCSSISAYIYNVILYYLSNDGLDSIEPSSHLGLFLYPLDYSYIWISWKYNQSKTSDLGGTETGYFLKSTVL
jgi:hypothetical protein